MKKHIVVLTVLLSFFLSAMAQSKTVLFTLEDRDRIMRTEQAVISLRNEMNTKFESIDDKLKSMEDKFDTKFESLNTKIESQQTQISDLKTMFFWGFGILISLNLFTLGYVIWDRRTALNPIQKTTES